METGSTLASKPPLLQRNAVSGREMFFHCPWNLCCSCPRVPKERADFLRLGSAPGTCRPLLSSKDQLAFSCLLCRSYFPPGHCCMLFVSGQGRGQVGKAQLDASSSVYKSLLRLWLWSCCVLTVPATGDRVSAAESCFSRAVSSYPALPPEQGWVARDLGCSFPGRCCLFPSLLFTALPLFVL